MQRLIAVMASGLAFATATGCSSESLPVSCEGPLSPGPSPIRRLTRVEYNNTVFQLLGDTTFPASAFAPDEEANGFDNQASALVVSPLLAEQYLSAAEDLAARHADNLLTNLPACTGGSMDQTSCERDAEAFIRSFGLRTFRRPLTSEEVQTHRTLFVEGTGMGDGTYDPRTGLQLVVQAMLQSPHFLYRVENGMPDPVEGDVVQLTSYEMASRLSYLFWNTMPDAALFDAAANDELRTKEQIEVQARRMISAPRAREAVKNFHRQWLDLDRVPGIAATGKDRTVYPDYDETLLPLLQRETEEFLDYLIFEERGNVEDMFTASYSMMNNRVAEFYGVSIPDDPEDRFRRVELDSSQYSGFLTQAGLLALHATADGSSPIHRGIFVREKIFCQPPPPPPDIVPEPPTVDPNETTRNQYIQHKVDPSCNGCHQMIDPIGFGFEHFDALGRYRETQGEKMLPIDATGEIVGTDDADGPFDGAVELSHRLGASNRVRNCVASQWFRFGYGRTETEEDECSIDTIQAAFAEADYDIQELLVALTQTDAFRYRRRAQAEVAQ